MMAKLPKPPGYTETHEKRSERIQGLLDRVRPDRRPQIEKRLAQVPRSLRANYLRTVTGTRSMKLRCKMFCLECCGWQKDEVAQCTAKACPLWEIRPCQTAKSKST